MKRELGIGTVD